MKEELFYQPHFTDKDIPAESLGWIHTILTIENLSIALWSGCYCWKCAHEETQALRNWNYVAEAWEVKAVG